MFKIHIARFDNGPNLRGNSHVQNCEMSLSRERSKYAEKNISGDNTSRSKAAHHRI